MKVALSWIHWIAVEMKGVDKKGFDTKGMIWILEVVDLFSDDWWQVIGSFGHLFSVDLFLIIFAI